MKSIIVYTREQRPQNLYPRRIVSPPAPNKCCPARMEVLGRPRLDEQGRRFSYKRCKVCGFALRHFLDPVGTVLPSPAADARARKAASIKARGPGSPGAAPVLGITVPPALPAPRATPVGRPLAVRKPPARGHAARPAAASRPHAAASGRGPATRRRR